MPSWNPEREVLLRDSDIHLTSPLPGGLGRRPERETARALSLHPVTEHALPALRFDHRRTTSHALSVPALDQGQTGTCEGHAWEHALLAAPIEHRRYPAPGVPGPFDIYRGACALDEFPDNDDGNLQLGTSTRACAAWLAQRGIVGHYDWCASAENAANWVGARDAGDRPVGGPVVIGVDWYWEDVDAQGFLPPPQPGQAPLGGHAVALLAWNERYRYFTGVNSWGPSWGLRIAGKTNGRFKLRFAVLDALLAAGGDACAPVELRHPARVAS
jgi:hypothetical protein